MAAANAIVRRGLRLLINLEPDLSVCGEAEGAEDAFRRICVLRPDVAVIDLTLRQGDGLVLIVRLHHECPRMRILVVSMHNQAAWITASLHAGAHGYLTKDESTDHLIHAMRRILRGRRFLSQRTLGRLGGRHVRNRFVLSHAGLPGGPLPRPTRPPARTLPTAPVSPAALAPHETG